MNLQLLKTTKMVCLLVFGLAFTGLQAQQTIAIEDFDDSTPSWSNDIESQTFVDPSTPDEGLFIQAASTDNANFSGNAAFGRDLGGESGEPSLNPHTFTFQDVSVAGFINVTVSFDYAVSANADDGSYEVVIDGTGQGQVQYYDDPDSGVETGTITVNIPDGTSTVGLILTGTLNGGSDTLELDNFTISGITSGGNIPPSIANIAQLPAEDNVTSSDNVLVTADVTDSDDNLDTVELNWGTTSGSLTNTLTMTVSSGDTYEATIPAQANGTTVYYEIEATDDDSSPETTTSTEQTYTVDDNAEIASEDFENCGNIIFTTESLASSADWSCENAGYMEVNAFSSDEAANDWLISQPFNLDLYSNEVLNFESYTQFADNGNAQPLRLYYTTNYTGDASTTSWTEITSATFAPEDSSTWTPSGDVDVSGISGTDVRFAFNYMSSGNGGGTTSQWRVDNFMLSGIASGNTPPTITNIARQPTMGVTPADPVSVLADVTDDNTVSTVTLNWGTTSGSLTNTINMSQDVNDTYETDSQIPAQADGTTVYFTVEAEDNDGSITTSLEQSYTVVDTPSLIISEIGDPGDSFGARFIEVYNNGTSTIDFDAIDVYVVRYTNDNSSISGDGVQLNGQLAAGDYYVIAQNQTDFLNAFGFSPDLSDNDIGGNGDDTHAIYVGGDDQAGSLLDIYGEIGVDGTGQPWEYEDARGVRNMLSYSPKTTWTASEWDITSADAEDMTPGTGEATVYTFNNGWTPANPVGNALPTDNIVVENGTATISSDLEISDITVDSGARLNIEAVLNVNGDITNNGDFIFVSNASTTGQLAEVSSNTNMSGDFTVHRFIPSGNRAFRFLTSAVTTTSTINGNWQEGATSATDNPENGFGTHITGSTTGDNGFDATISGNPSMFTYDNLNQTWDAIDNTDSNMLEAGTPYRIYVRGDRSIDLTNNNATATATTLSARGDLAIGDQLDADFSEVAGDFNFFGNPYQAIVDMAQVTAASTNINTNQYYVWDPNLSTAGAYVTVDLATGNPTPSGSDANQYIMPGQAGFVTTLNNGTASILFQESSKATSQMMTSTFKNANMANNNSFINIELYQESAYLNNEAVADGVKLKFDANNNNAVMANDAVKLSNIDENLALNNNGTYLSIESRALPQAGDVIPFYNDNYRASNYVFEISIENIAGVDAYLNDAYLGTQTLLEDNVNTVNFMVDENTPASFASDRFSLSFAQESLSTKTEEKANFTLFPNPSENGVFTLQLAEGNNNGDVSVSIYNLLGQEVYSTKRAANGNQVTVRDANLSAGLYVVKANVNGNTTSQKLMVK